MNDNDPRVFFAAERTLLAWLRTGLTIIALGFVVARFGLFVQVLSLQPQPHSPGISSSVSAGLGVTFVVVGSLAILAAAFQHSRFVATLSPPDLPPAYSRNVSVALSIVVAALGIALAAYLLVA
jgi:putative membrane protein